MPYEIKETISYDPTARDLSVEISKAKATGAEALLARHGIAASEVEGIVHASTVASNTILEGLGARHLLVESF